MFSGVGKTGSPISRWMTLRPCASSIRAFASTSKAPSVPRFCMRLANLTAKLENAPGGDGVDDDRLPRHTAGLRGAEVGAEVAQLGGVAIATHRQVGGVALELFLEADARRLGV